MDGAPGAARRPAEHSRDTGQLMLPFEQAGHGSTLTLALQDQVAVLACR
jgi:hypothetical protein